MQQAVHIPVLLTEVVEALRPERGGVYLDATLGLGGHAEALLSAAGTVRVIGIDRDPEALRLSRERLARFGDRLVTLEGRHEDVAPLLSELGVARVDGVLADLGVSSMQLDQAARGFSFMYDGPLDMRMSGSGPTAADIVATSDARELARIFRDYGEERMAGRIARTIVNAREEAPVDTTSAMRRLVTRAIGPQREAQRDPATRVFQALRIATNQELVDLERFLDDAIARLSLGSRMTVLAYHSLEDRIVKNVFARHTAGCTCPPSFPVCVCSRRRVMALVTRKPLRPSLDEIRENPRSRSAKMRVIERVAEGTADSPDGAPPGR
ncbi:MAG: 16S rRNA (cytosine(1402)-N(4))-methyltransferase RsmH [Thermoanaerobaculia bacterium]